MSLENRQSHEGSLRRHQEDDLSLLQVSNLPALANPNNYYDSSTTTTRDKKRLIIKDSILGDDPEADIFNWILDTVDESQPILPPVQIPSQESATVEMEEENLIVKNQCYDQDNMMAAEVLFEGQLPVQETNDVLMANMWSQGAILSNTNEDTTFAVDPMSCHNPLEVEGRTVDQEEASTTVIAEQLLSTFMPSSGNETDQHDLLNMILNDTIQPEGQDFQDFIKEDEDSLDTIDINEILPSTSAEAELTSTPPPTPETRQPVKRGRGRPRIPRTEPPAPKRRGRPPTSAVVVDLSDYDSASGLSSEDVRYRRMRDLNNAASKRCRMNRKRKFEGMESEEKQLQDKNKALKSQLARVESTAAKLKKIVFEKIANKKATFDIDQLMANTLSKM